MAMKTLAMCRVMIVTMASTTLVLLAAHRPAGAAPGPAAPCLSVENDRDRLACYDRLFGRVGSTATEGPESSEDTPATGGSPAGKTAPEAAARQQLGAEQLPSRRSEPDEPPDETSEIVVILDEVGRRADGRYWFRLDNDQLWSQVSAKRASFESGDLVRIRRGLLGTYHLRPADGSGRSTQVRREE